MKSIVIWNGPSSVVYSLIGVIFLIGFGMKMMEMLTPIFLAVLGLVSIGLIIGAAISGIMSTRARTPGDFLGRYLGWCGLGVLMLGICLGDLFGTVTRTRGFWPFNWTETITTQTGHVAKNLTMSGWFLLLTASILGIASWLSHGTQESRQSKPA